jgi:hypothetical protein
MNVIVITFLQVLYKNKRSFILFQAAYASYLTSPCVTSNSLVSSLPPPSLMTSAALSGLHAAAAAAMSSQQPLSAAITQGPKNHSPAEEEDDDDGGKISPGVESVPPPQLVAALNGINHNNKSPSSFDARMESIESLRLRAKELRGGGDED